MTIFHETAHVIFHNAPKLKGYVKRIYDTNVKIRGDYNSLAWLGDYHSNSRALGYNFPYCPSDENYHGMVAEGISIDTQKIFDVSLARAKLGYYAPLAIFLVTLYSFRTSNDNFRFYTSTIDKNNQFKISVTEKKVVDILKSIPSAYLKQIQQIFGIDFNNFNLPLLIN